MKYHHSYSLRGCSKRGLMRGGGKLRSQYLSSSGLLKAVTMIMIDIFRLYIYIYKRIQLQCIPMYPLFSKERCP